MCEVGILLLILVWVGVVDYVFNSRRRAKP